MGLFSFLFGSSEPSTVEVLSDRIWMSQQAKWKGIRKEIEERSASGAVVILLVAHFADTLEQLDAIAAQPHGGAPVTATLVEALSNDIAVRLKDETATIDLIVGERHPLREVDESLLEFAKEVPCRCRVAHHLSLDDPLLKLFSGEWVAGVLKKLGMTENESIQSSMVSRRVKDAQKKIHANAIGDSKVGSAAEWLERNMPPT